MKVQLSLSVLCRLGMFTVLTQCWGASLKRFFFKRYFGILDSSLYFVSSLSTLFRMIS